MVKWRSSSVNSLIVLSFYTLICKTSTAAGSALSYAVSSVLSSASGDELGMSVSQSERTSVERNKCSFFLIFSATLKF